MKQPIRIACFVGKWNGYGVETLVFNCYKNIDREKFQFDFFVDENSDRSSVPFDEVKKLGGRIYLIPPVSKIFRYIKVIKKIAKTNKYLIAHAHINTLCVFPLFACKIAGVPIRIAHNHATAGNCEYLKSLIKYILRPFAKTFSTHYAASSIYGGEWLFGKKCFEKYDMLYLPVARNLNNYIYNKDIRDKKRAEMGLDNKFVIGHVGRFVPVKNHKFLVDIFKRIQNEEKDSVLLLAGDGELEENIKKQVKDLGLTDKVRFLGKRTDVNELLQAMDVFILPSFYEGISGAGIEAQAAGLPFLFSDTITAEAGVVSYLSNRLPLEKGASYWANVALNTRKIERKDTYKIMQDKGYEIKNASKNLASYYTKFLAENFPEEIAN